MSENIRDQLLSELFVSTEDHSRENFKKHTKGLARYRFSRLLDISAGFVTPPLAGEYKKTLPAEKEVLHLLSNDHRDLFLQNILYHLHRNLKQLPSGLLPHLLKVFKSSPAQWQQIYRHFPELTLALARSNSDWDYMTAAFDPAHTPQIGSHLFYESMIHRIRQFPDATSGFIRHAFPAASDHHQVKLLEVLSFDPYPENKTFLLSLLKGQRKPIRMIALKAALQHKYPDIYRPILKILQSQERNASKDASKKLTAIYPHFWKDLASFTSQPDRQRSLVAAADPDDLPEEHLLHDGTEVVRHAALLHKNQNSLSFCLLSDPETPQREEIIKFLRPETAVKILQKRYLDPVKDIDGLFFDLLTRIRPHVDEKTTSHIWARFVAHWNDLPFYFDPYPLEVWAARIHPNQLKRIWQDPILQSTEPEIQTFREILKHRLAFLKKCYT